MAPFSPLPFGFSPRSPKVSTHARPFRTIFGQTLPRRQTSEPPLICGPESKGWMTCLALSCFLVVVWLAALPTSSSVGDALLSGRMHDLGDGAGSGLMWLYDEPEPIVGYGRGMGHKGEAETGQRLGSAVKVKMAPVNQKRTKMGFKKIKARVDSSPAAGQGNNAGPAPTLIAAPSSAAKSAPTHTSSMFDSPEYAEQPTAQKTGDPSDGGPSAADSANGAQPTPGDAMKPRSNERRRSRLRIDRSRHYMGGDVE